jgi:NAD-dependent deacetylase
MISVEQPGAIQRARQLVAEANHLVAFTGAGMSTASGIPDFRSKGSGLWEHDDPMEVASLTTFRNNPRRFWDWKRGLMRQVWRAQPNPAHLALARLEKAGRLEAIITQNIDGLHQQAGSTHVYELHGTIQTLTCPGCGHSYPTEQFRALIETSEEMPRCPTCRLVLKPDVVLFEEQLPQITWEAAERHCTQADVILVAGSSLEVWPAATLPEMAVSNGAQLILVNYSPTFLDPRAEVLLRANVAEILPLLAHGLD